jgi:hypothetical protein
MADAPLVMNQTRGALWGGKCGDLGRGGFDDDDDGALLVMSEIEVMVFAPCRLVCTCFGDGTMRGASLVGNSTMTLVPALARENDFTHSVTTTTLCQELVIIGR